LWLACGKLKATVLGSTTPDLPQEPDGTAIGAQNLSKVFGNFRAVNQINLDIRYGEVFGLWGERKTTTIKMLCGLLPASSGE